MQMQILGTIISGVRPLKAGDGARAASTAVNIAESFSGPGPRRSFSLFLHFLSATIGHKINLWLDCRRPAATAQVASANIFIDRRNPYFFQHLPTESLWHANY